MTRPLVITFSVPYQVVEDRSNHTTKTMEPRGRLVLGGDLADTRTEWLATDALGVEVWIPQLPIPAPIFTAHVVPEVLARTVLKLAEGRLDLDAGLVESTLFATK